MDTNNQQSLINEWTTLHGDYEKYEQFSLAIKLFTIAICFLCLALSIQLTLGILFILTLWLQEGIWKTYQARTEVRLLAIEAQLQTDTQHSATDSTYSFYSSWEKIKPGAIGLIAEYLSNSIRPTVMYPYLALIAISILSTLI